MCIVLPSWVGVKETGFLRKTRFLRQSRGSKRTIFPINRVFCLNPGLFAQKWILPQAVGSRCRISQNHLTFFIGVPPSRLHNFSHRRLRINIITAYFPPAPLLACSPADLDRLSPNRPKRLHRRGVRQGPVECRRVR
ncbi:hypothetical protein MiSe_92870 [Microseira wollei NIES-4236]|uniref:Uncharacterized protein n=1 Tax=Microseira wollei NIES-4236 TaxID=2530354 RepID=A0AAV3XRM0_9CYAN|nr:hypothetical protein MiSe_92870 [Microseira wollei NIES-4236]